MKQFMLCLCLLLIVHFVHSQSYNGTVAYQRTQQPAAVIDLPYNSDIVSACLNEYLSKKGRSKSTDLKGFTTYRNTQPVVNDSANADMYFKIERKSRRERDNTILSLLLRNPRPNPGTDVLHHLTMDEAKMYLNELVPAIQAYNVEVEIEKQNEAVAKAEAAYKNLMQDQQDLEKKKSTLEQKLSENKVRQDAQLKTIELEKQKLAEKVSQRSGS